MLPYSVISKSDEYENKYLVSVELDTEHVKEKIKTISETIEELEERVDEIEKELKKIKEKIKESETKLDGLEKEKEQLVKFISNLGEDENNGRKEKARLKEIKSSIIPEETNALMVLFAQYRESQSKLLTIKFLIEANKKEKKALIKESERKLEVVACSSIPMRGVVSDGGVHFIGGNLKKPVIVLPLDGQIKNKDFDAQVCFTSNLEATDTFYMLAIYTGWLKWNQKYCIAEITSVDREAETAKAEILPLDAPQKLIEKEIYPFDEKEIEEKTGFFSYEVGDKALVELNAKNKSFKYAGWFCGGGEMKKWILHLDYPLYFEVSGIGFNGDTEIEVKIAYQWNDVTKDYISLGKVASRLNEYYIPSDWSSQDIFLGSFYFAGINMKERIYSEIASHINEIKYIGAPSKRFDSSYWWRTGYRDGEEVFTRTYGLEYSRRTYVTEGGIEGTETLISVDNNEGYVSAELYLSSPNGDWVKAYWSREYVSYKYKFSSTGQSKYASESLAYVESETWKELNIYFFNVWCNEYNFRGTITFYENKYLSEHRRYARVTDKRSFKLPFNPLN